MSIFSSVMRMASVAMGGSDAAPFPFTLGSEIIAPHPSPHWRLFSAVHTSTNEPHTVFSFDKARHDTAALSLARNALQKLKTLRYPYILRYVDSSDSPTHLLIATEACSPFQHDFVRGDRKREYGMALGLYAVTKAVSWMNNDCRLVHGALCPASIFLLKSGEYRLFGLDLAYKHGDSTGTFNSSSLTPAQRASFLPSFYRSPEMAKASSPAYFTTIEQDPASPTPVHYLDAWSLGVLIFDLHSNGTLSSPAQLANKDVIHPLLQTEYKRLLSTNPVGRINPSVVLSSTFFSSNDLVRTVNFLSELAIQSSGDKDAFFLSFAKQVGEFPEPILKYRVLPQLLDALSYGSGMSCLTGDHTVLTRSGWRSLVVIHQQFEVARVNRSASPVVEVSSFNHSTSAMEWKRVTHTQCFPAGEQRLFRMQGEGMDVCATEDHRMVTCRMKGGAFTVGSFDFETVGELLDRTNTVTEARVKDKVQKPLTQLAHSQVRAVVRCGDNRQPHFEFSIELLKLACAWWCTQDQQRGFLRFLGFWLGDGHLDVQDGRVVISQRELEATAWLIDLLDEVFPRWWYRNVSAADDKGITFSYHIRCPPLYEWLRCMAVGPAGYNPLDDVQLRAYPHFTRDAEVERQEAASSYGPRTAAHKWTEAEMLQAFSAGRVRRSCCVCADARGVRLSCSGSHCHSGISIKRAHPECVGRTAAEAFSRRGSGRTRQPWPWFCSHSECQEDAATWAAVHPPAPAPSLSPAKPQRARRGSPPTPQSRLTAAGADEDEAKEVEEMEVGDAEAVMPKQQKTRSGRVTLAPARLGWEEKGDEEGEEGEEVDTLVCYRCGEAEWDEEGNAMLVCDGCNCGGHLQCIGLSEVPQGAWFCLACVDEEEGDEGDEEDGEEYAESFPPSTRHPSVTPPSPASASPPLPSRRRSSVSQSDAGDPIAGQSGPRRRRTSADSPAAGDDASQRSPFTTQLFEEQGYSPVDATVPPPASPISLAPRPTRSLRSSSASEAPHSISFASHSPISINSTRSRSSRSLPDDEEGDEDPIEVDDEDAPRTAAAGARIVATGVVWNNGAFDIDEDGNWFYRKRWMGANVASTFANLSQPQAIALLEGFCRADGDWADVQFDNTGEPRGRWHCSNSSFPLIDHLQLIGQLCGARVDLKRRTQAGKVSTGFTGRKVEPFVDHWRLSFNFNRTMGAKKVQLARLAKPEDVSTSVDARGYYMYQDDGFVYDLTVEDNHNFLTQRLSMKRHEGAPGAREAGVEVRAHPVIVGNCFPSILTSVLKIGNSLSPAEYAALIIPAVSRLFSSNERVVRVHLLSNIEQYGQHLPADMVNDTIFKHVLTGFHDSQPILREVTMKSMPHFVSKLNTEHLQQALVQLAKMQTDNEPAIRTNTSYCIAKLAPSFNAVTREKVLANAFARALKDPFAPARVAGCVAFAATIDYHSAAMCGKRIIPVVAPLAVDDVSEVREAALKAINALLGKVTQFHQDGGVEQPSAAAQEDRRGEGAVGDAAASASALLANVSSWAVSSFASKFYGSGDIGSGTAPQTPTKGLSAHPSFSSPAAAASGAPSALPSPTAANGAFSPSPPSDSNGAVLNRDGWDDDFTMDDAFGAATDDTESAAVVSLTTKKEKKNSSAPVRRAAGSKREEKSTRTRTPRALNAAVFRPLTQVVCPCASRDGRARGERRRRRRLQRRSARSFLGQLGQLPGCALYHHEEERRRWRHVGLRPTVRLPARSFCRRGGAEEGEGESESAAHCSACG